MEELRVTSKCNNNCAYCPLQRSPFQEEPSLEYLKGVIKKIRGKGRNRVMLTGGEPLLRKDIFEILEYAQKKGLKTGLKTNGRLAFYKAYSDFLVNSSLSRITVDFPSSDPDVFDSITRVEGSFFQTLGGLKNLLSLEERLRVNIPLLPENYRNLKGIFILLKRIGVRGIQISSSSLEEGALLYWEKEKPVTPDVVSELRAGLSFCQKLNFEKVNVDYKIYSHLKGGNISFSSNKAWGGYEMAFPESSPEPKETHVYVQTNSSCNQKCVFCNRPPTSDYKESQEVSLEDIKERIDEFSQEWDIKRVILTGGEPLLHPKLPELVNYVKRYGFITEIQTNGTLLNVDKLTELKEAGLDIINFAFHSHKEKISNRLRGVNFGYQKIIDNLKLANKMGFEIHMIHVINSLNYQDLPEFIDYINNMKLHGLYLNLSIVVPEGWAWKNKWIIPRMRDIKPYLIEAMKRCEKYNFKFDVSEIVPLCIVEGFEGHAVSTLFKLSKVKISDDYYTGTRILDFSNPNSEQAAKAPQCKECSLNDICAGFYPRLKELYGTDDFIPRHEDPKLILEKIRHESKKVTDLFKNKNIEAVTHEKGRNPNRLYISLDEKCNENCVFCVVKGENVGKFGSMETEEAERIIKEFIEYGGKEIFFTGGEPTLREDLPQIIEYAEQFDGLKSISVITNGTGLAKTAYFQKLIQADRKKKISFCFSLHSHKREVSEFLTGSQGTFKDTIAGLENVIKEGRKASIYQVITSKNYKDLLEFSEFLNNNYPGIRDITFAYPFPQGNALLNKWIYVKLSLLRPHLVRALQFLEKEGYTISIAACGQFPLCAVPGFEEKVISPLEDSEENISGVVGEKAFHDFEMASEEWVNQYKGKTKECEKCVLNRYCQGFWKEYIDLFGFDGINPVGRNNFRGKKIEVFLKTESQVEEVVNKMEKGKMNLILLSGFVDNPLMKLKNSLKKKKILAVILSDNDIIYP